MSDLITGKAFNPVAGKSYEIHFGKLTIGNETGFVSARIRADGVHYTEWVDLDTNEILDPRISCYVVQAFKEI